MRAELWRWAYRIYSAIIETPQAHPGHESQHLNRNAWTPVHCEAAFQRVIAAHAWLRDLLDGNFVRPALSRIQYSGAYSYFELPAAAVEQRVGAPELDMSLGLDIPAASAAAFDDEDSEQIDGEDLPEDDELDDEDGPAESSDSVTVTTRLVEVITSDAQMTLF